METSAGSKWPCPAYSKDPGDTVEDESSLGDHAVNPAADTPGWTARGLHPPGASHTRKSVCERARALRVNINARERRRMHDLNDALDELRAAMPYRAGPTAKKLSKIATLLLARNHILLQARALEQMSRMVGHLKSGHSVDAGAVLVQQEGTSSASLWTV